ncbi:LysR family transcriptional regulator [Devosia psychrophila]|uniref:LysR family transcriptional regulator n=1 Tax=Devosia psychrophila TaxID=728005 RepID=A0A0F5PTP2_9HYPH|nr:LysR family transcriptional regulator [Devosia psychrophila]KKC32047.1 LysR family transcriptional regulator [Devosia psychrophila]SFD36713.1 transcriptional regulator, LysR family [Devosia psychrophila]
MNILNFHHLRYFMEVASEGNLTRAARNLAVSQSALSTQIQLLEARLGHPLFERVGRRLVLTEAGRVALDHAKAIFEIGDDLLTTLRVGSGRRQVLRVGALATLSRNFQIDFLRPCLGRPNLEIVLTSGSLVELTGMLRQLDLDVVLCNGAPGTGHADGVAAHRIARQQISLFGATALDCRATTPQEAISSQGVILPGGSSSIRADFDALCARLDVMPKVVAEVDDMAMLRLMAREAIGLVPLPAIVVRDELEAGTLREIVPLPGIEEAFYALTFQRQFQSPVAEELIAAASNWCD